MLAGKVSKVTFETYIRPTVPISYEEDIVTLGVMSDFARDWLEKKASNQIRSAMEFHLDAAALQIKFVVQPRDVAVITANYPVSQPKVASSQRSLPLDSEEEDPYAYQNAQARTTAPRPPANSKRATQAAAPDRTPPPGIDLNQRFLFENFLVGKSNRLAHASAMAVATEPGAVYNPLFLYGDPGLGKTHLMQAIAHMVKTTHPAKGVAYVSGEHFAQQYITSIREHTTEAFRKQYRKVDVWLVDDIQFIGGKEHTKEEFFYTFNELYQAGKQIVIASDRSPRELNTIDERLRSRFQSGLIADIGAPAIETRIAFLESCRDRDNAKVSNEVLHYIADAIQSNMRTLDGALTKLVAYSSIMNIPVSSELAQSVLGEYFIQKPLRATRLTVEEVIDGVSERLNITPVAIKGPGRLKEVTHARHMAIYLCRELLSEMNTVMIGKAFGNRDHATVVHACKKMRQLMENDSDLKTEISNLIRSFAK